MKPKHQSNSLLRIASLGAILFSMFVVEVLCPVRLAIGQDRPAQMLKVRISDDGHSFVLGDSGQAFVPWGFNYLGEYGKLIEESWDSDWERVERDFRAMRKLGANVARIHLQFGTYMSGPDEFDQAQLDRLKKMLDLGSQVGLYLDITGLSCYRLDGIPAWYDAMDESERWAAQERWWKMIAKTCAGHPAVFCYDLMNEPVVGGPPKEGEPRWVGGEIDDLYFVQRISQEPGKRKGSEIAEAWVAMLTSAIREQDAQTPITVGVIPWALVWPTAKPFFYSPEIAKNFDFVSIHAYPDHDKLDENIAALAVYDIGKPLVVEETFPLSCTLDDMDRFIEGGKDRVDGWISHYFGYSIEEHEAGAEPHGIAPDAPFGATVADFLKFWSEKGESIKESQAGGTDGGASGHIKAKAEDGASGASGGTDGGASGHIKAKTEDGTSSASGGTDGGASGHIGLRVRGSVEQIHIVHAEPNSHVTVDGPSCFHRAASTDDRGGLIVRDAPVGSGYRVVVEGQGDTPQVVRVLGPQEHPDALSSTRPSSSSSTHGFIETRDGTLLAYRVVLPDRKVYGPGPYDLIVTYSGYQPSLETNNSYQNKPFEQFSELGYAVAGVNMRGSSCSGGAFDFMEPLTWLDGYDFVEAFSAQAWVDDVALGDQSWPGLTQLYVASTQPPSLDAIVAGSVVGDLYRDVFYPGGIQNIGFGHIWAAGRDMENAFPSSRPQINAHVEADPMCAANQALRGQNINLRETIEQHPFDGDYWQSRSAESLVGRIKVPVLQVVSWQDPQVSSHAANLVERYASDTPVRLVGVNGFHQYWSGAVWDEVTQFLDVYLDDSSEAKAKVASYETQNDFVALLESNAAGEVRAALHYRILLPQAMDNAWLWGATCCPTRLPAADATGQGATGQGSASRFTYIPKINGGWSEAAHNQVSFTSANLTTETVMAGTGSVDLWIAVDAEDVDLQVTLSEVRPDGQEMLVQSGWLRASHRQAGRTSINDAPSTAIAHRRGSGKPRAWRVDESAD
ncbi:MAG: CocE/NonD family hydrolase [Pirellulaceae bacterium]